MAPTSARSFAAAVPPGCVALVLGSIPGVASLAAGEYYAHPRNLFWDAVEEAFGVRRSGDYAARVDALNARGIGLWDMIGECIRPGSADAAIVRGSVVANEVAELYRSRPHLQFALCNGKTAARLFARHVVPALDCPVPVTWFSLPSTSPAYAAMPRGERVAVWASTLAAVAASAQASGPKP
ncbi:MAG: DNA-deoxyinosine glycosylase [Myxococcales bacterium]|nr:DNA-deoxyinosine glycosylase [Myxococcales bacterium]